MQQRKKSIINDTPQLAFVRRAHDLRSAKTALDESEARLTYRTDVLERWANTVLSQYGEEAIQQIVCKTISHNDDLRISPAIREWACSKAVADIPQTCETKLHPTYLNALAFYLSKKDRGKTLSAI